MLAAWDGDVSMTSRQSAGLEWLVLHRQQSSIYFSFLLFLLWMKS